MSSTTVAEFASELKKSTETLLEQLRSAGVAKSAPGDALSDADKQKLLGFLQASHGTAAPERKKITLVKKSTSEIKQADSTGKARTIQVEVRKKRTFVKRDEGGDTAVIEAPEPEAPSAPPAAPASHIDEAELSRREEEARRQAELIRRQEEDLAEKRRQREEAEKRDREAEERAANYAATEEQKKTAATTEKAEATQEATDAAAARAAAQAEAREKAAAESKARADEEAARAVDLGDRRRKAEAEAAAIRTMLSSPKKVLVPHKPPEKAVAKAEPAKPAAKGTLHKPAVGTGTGRPAAGAPALEAAAATTATTAKTMCRPHRSKRASSKCTCPKPSPWLSWRTRWPSRRKRSSSS